MDPSPVNYEFDESKVSLLLNVDGKDILLERGIVKGKNKVWINEVPKKATEFSELVDSLFEKELFFSLYNPHYFFTLHWEKQRSMVLQYVTPPANKEVLAALPKLQADKLASLIKKYTLDDLKKLHSERKNKLEKEAHRADGSIQTYENMLGMIEVDSDNDETLKQLQELEDKSRELETAWENVEKTNRPYKDKLSELENVKAKIDVSKEGWGPIKEEVIKTHCRCCGQELDEDSKLTAEEVLESKKKTYLTKHKALVSQKEAIFEALEELQYVEPEEAKQAFIAVDRQIPDLQKKVRSHQEYKRLNDQVSAAKDHKKQTIDDLNESIFILDAVKAFLAKEAELQGEKVQALFETLSVRLFETQKNGEIKPSFVVQMDGKDYNKLSLSESIRAGLELREVLSEQSGIIAPTIVDNSESITKFKGPSGQLIMSRVVASKELEVTADEER